MMKIFVIEDKITQNLSGLEKKNFYKFITKSQSAGLDVAKQTEEIISQTKKDGDKALINLSNKFDKTNFKKPNDFVIGEEEIKSASENVSEEVKSALNNAFKRIKDYHGKQLPKDFSFKDKEDVELANLWRAIESVGVYAPGGSASYPSSVLMSAVPAIVAGVKDITLCVPSSAGRINDAVLYAAQICGITKIYKVGGAQAITALAHGTKTIEKVNKIVGPGNSYVSYAKKFLFGEVGIDMIAGPTDVTIIADKDNNPDWIAADALSQLEHGPDSKAFIITDSEEFALRISLAITTLAKDLARKKIIAKSLKNSAIFVIKELIESTNLSNFIAPEHLEIAAKNPDKFVDKINNAGAIFLGKYTPEAIGDYMAGPSHTLPTSGSAKFSSGLSVYDFLKRISLISCNKESFDNLSQDTANLAGCEGLDAHKLSVEIRK